MICHTAHENNTWSSCDPEALVGQIEVSPCAVLISSSSQSSVCTNMTVNLCCGGRNNTTGSEGETLDNVTLIHGVLTSTLILNCLPDNASGKSCCQFLEPKFSNNSNCSNSNTIKLNSSLTDICLHNRNDSELSTNCSVFSCRGTSQSTNEDSACIAPMLFYGVAGSLLLTNVMLLLVIMMFCAACLSHNKKLTQPYRKNGKC